MATQQIYAICDPQTGEVRYIGQARDAKQRYEAHKLQRTPISDWILEQEAAGRTPFVVVLTEIHKVSVGDWQWFTIACNAAERALIEHFHHTRPCELLNRAKKPTKAKSSLILQREPDGFLPAGKVVVGTPKYVCRSTEYVEVPDAEEFA